MTFTEITDQFERAARNGTALTLDMAESSTHNGGINGGE